MISVEIAENELRTIVWEEGKREVLMNGPYRFQIMIKCSSAGRRKGIFADGQERNYFSFIRIVNGKGQWGGQGGIIVPVLPDKRLLMVVEQRPPMHEFADIPHELMLDSGPVDLRVFGPFSSVEFPGGAVEVGEELSVGIFRELTEETGIIPTGTVYQKNHPHYHMASDMATRDYLSVVYLAGANFALHTESDGGLAVLALTEQEVRRNIRNGVISSANAALLPFDFYCETKYSPIEPMIMDKYFSVKEVELKLS